MAHTYGNADAFHTPITRYYVDTRPYAPISATAHLNPPKRQDEHLPLLHTLPLDTQNSINRYVRKPDRFMSLSSALLKHLFIHKTAKIPWSQVSVSRTPKPHGRPYWAPPSDWFRKGFEGLEFNVSHQAGMIVLVGCRTPNRPRDVRLHDISGSSSSTSTSTTSVSLDLDPDPTALSEFASEIDEDEPEDVRIGVDVACTWEPPRTPDLSSQEKLEEWIDVFSEMFSVREQYDMKWSPVDEVPGSTELQVKARRFYTYWALKEAYIKMVGEGLLAPWLRELEFKGVIVPRVPGCENGMVDCRATIKGASWLMANREETTGMGVLIRGKDISHTMETTLEAFDESFLVATMTRGVTDTSTSTTRWEKIDIFGEIELCATGKCHCLD